MTVFLKQSTAVDVALGPFLDATDGVTAETGLTIAQADVRLKKNAGAWAQVNDATSATHEENGWYEKELDATDTNTVGRLLIAVHESGALPVWHEFWVLEEAIYDAIFAASATGALPVSDGGITTSTFAAGAINAAAIATDAIGAAELADGAITAATFAAGAIDATAIANAAIDAATFAAGAIDAAALAADAATELNAPILAVIGALNDAAAAGAVTTTDTMVAYLKQIINELSGAAGIETWPAAAAPGNAVSLAEAIRSIYDDTNELQVDDYPTRFDTVDSALTTIDNFLDTEIAAILEDTGTTLQAELDGIQADTEDIQARLPAALTAGGNIKADVLAISGDTTAADRLEALMDGVIIGQVNDAAATTTAFAADGFTEATDDHFVGRLITFISGALTGQQTNITDYDAAGGAQGNQQFTVTALTEAPADDVFFVIH